jgi:hypothetical protein
MLSAMWDGATPPQGGQMAMVTQVDKCNGRIVQAVHHDNGDCDHTKIEDIIIHSCVGGGYPSLRRAMHA